MCQFSLTKILKTSLWAFHFSHILIFNKVIEKVHGRLNQYKIVVALQIITEWRTCFAGFDFAVKVS